MTSLFFQNIQQKLARTALADLAIKTPFTIPSGVVTTVPSVIAAIAREVPEIGFLTTKTVSLQPRPGYREPIVHEYYPGCFVNAVGLANPGAESFLRSMAPLLPLYGNKPLVVSIMGESPQDFLDCAAILDPIANAFELNLSCPHVKGAGQSVGSDPAAVSAVIRLLKGRVKKLIIPKLSPNLGDIPGMARLCRDAGADALCLINTVGPGMAVDAEGNPILTNTVGGLSGSGILPVGLKAVREAVQAVDLPIIAAGGIGSADDVRAYAAAGASLFAVGSALAGMTTPGIAQFFSALTASLDQEPTRISPSRCLANASRTTYVRTRVVENTQVGAGIFKVRMEDGPVCDPGRFFFLRLPGVGEKPFSPAHDMEPVYLVRTVGPFTAALEKLKPGDTVYMRGPYGKGFPNPRPEETIVLIGGGTGSAPILMAGRRWPECVKRAFFGFSDEVTTAFRDEILGTVPSAEIAVDSPGKIGRVIDNLISNVFSETDLYRRSRVFVCGPAAMMTAAVQVLKPIVPVNNIFLAREDVMRCGIGLCGSCGTERGLRSCVDGPVQMMD
ncbi:MAG: dihydroorotate dehydrogenase [Desulfomonile tiedjei]|uniref:Dihydroorotate dehydrogenase n=1 Tax=Desulfomonile tiedjei TaxID=2358 RepID=A0A9D6Z4B4_9BACT|nr:dihydroorotate dehydrogenase [Desulfomonile tiedjei]